MHVRTCLCCSATHCATAPCIHSFIHSSASRTHGTSSHNTHGCGRLLSRPSSSAPSLSFVCVMFLSTVFAGPFSSVSERDGLGRTAHSSTCSAGRSSSWESDGGTTSDSSTVFLLVHETAFVVLASILFFTATVVRGLTARVIFVTAHRSRQWILGWTEYARPCWTGFGLRADIVAFVGDTRHSDAEFSFSSL